MWENENNMYELISHTHLEPFPDEDYSYFSNGI